MATLEKEPQAPRKRVRKRDRREQILLELKLRPHVRIAELAERFAVSAETVRRDLDQLAEAGLISRAHGGASAPVQGQYPDLDARSRDRQEERERIGQAAAALVRPGEAVMIDSGSTTLQAARFLAVRDIACAVITNSLPVAMTTGQNDGIDVILCPGEYLAPEAAVVGTDTIEYLERHNVDRCLIGASGLSSDGPSEAVRGFAAVKRTMLAHSSRSHLLIDSEKFGRFGLMQVGGLDAITSVVVDRAPAGALKAALAQADVDVMVAP